MAAFAFRRSGDGDLGLVGYRSDDLFSFASGGFGRFGCFCCRCRTTADGEREEALVLGGDEGSSVIGLAFSRPGEDDRDVFGSCFWRPFPDSVDGIRKETVGFALTGKEDFPLSDDGFRRARDGEVDTEGPRLFCSFSCCSCSACSALNRSRNEIPGFSFSIDGRFSFPNRVLRPGDVDLDALGLLWSCGRWALVESGFDGGSVWAGLSFP